MKFFNLICLIFLNAFALPLHYIVDAVPHPFWFFPELFAGVFPDGVDGGVSIVDENVETSGFRHNLLEQSQDILVF